MSSAIRVALELRVRPAHDALWCPWLIRGAAKGVPGLNRPGGNVTGFASTEASLGGKWLELLSEIAPGLKRAAIMFNPDLPPVSAYMPSLEMAARS
jgi:hypothetical protein